MRPTSTVLESVGEIQNMNYFRMHFSPSQEHRATGTQSPSVPSAELFSFGLGQKWIDTFFENSGSFISRQNRCNFYFRNSPKRCAFRSYIIIYNVSHHYSSILSLLGFSTFGSGHNLPVHLLFFSIIKCTRT